MKAHLTDSAELTLDEFCFRSNSRKWIPGSSRKCRDVIDAFRTVYWFHGLRIRLCDVATNLHALEKQLEPEAFGISRDGVSYRRNKWRWYQIGKHTPLDSLVSSIDRRYEGSRNDFSHVFWDILRLQNPVHEFSEQWVQRLDPTVQVLLLRRNRQSNGRLRRKKLDNRTIEVLERRASLDTLACLTLYLREAHELGDSEYAFELACRVCRMLLLASADVYSRGIALPLYEFFDQSILKLGAHQGLYPTYKAIGYLDLMRRLFHALHHIKGVNTLTLAPEQAGRYKQKILSWSYGWDYFDLFRPVELPVDERMAETNAFRCFWDAQCALRQWAWNGIYNPTTVSSPPATLWLAERDTRQIFMAHHGASKNS